MFGLVLLAAFVVRRLRGSTALVAERELPERIVT